jgi:hypothetical protein
VLSFTPLGCASMMQSTISDFDTTLFTQCFLLSSEQTSVFGVCSSLSSEGHSSIALL